MHSGRSLLAVCQVFALLKYEPKSATRSYTVAFEGSAGDAECKLNDRQMCERSRHFLHFMFYRTNGIAQEQSIVCEVSQ